MSGQVYLVVKDSSYKTVEDTRQISVFYTLKAAVDKKNEILAELCLRHSNHQIDSIVTVGGDDITRFRVPTPNQYEPCRHSHELNHVHVDRFKGELIPVHHEYSHHHKHEFDYIYQCIIRIESGILVGEPEAKPVPPPVPPKDLAITEVTSSSVTLTWTLQEGLTGYHLQYHKAGTEEWAEAIPVPVNTATTYTLTGLEELTEYYISLTAVNQAGSAFTNIVATTLDDLTNNLPTKPANLHVANITADTIQLTWDTQDNITGYEIYYQAVIDGDVWQTLAPLDAAAVGCTINTLTALTQYNFKVVAVNNNGTAIATGSATTLDDITP